jgi:hypothetical protein
MVGLGRLELPTSRLSGVRSNRLSYRPQKSGIRSQKSDPRFPSLAKMTGREARTAAQKRPKPHVLKSEMKPASRPFLTPDPRLLTPDVQKGGDPAAGSPTATLLRLHPSR